MKLNRKHTDFIELSFHNMQSKDDLIALVNYVKKTIFTNLLPPIKLNQVTFHAYHNKLRYKTFSIKKKNGSEREISSPQKRLKLIQKCLNVILECVYNPHVAAHGFICQRSIVTNARVHTGQIYVYNIDLKDFFYSIDQARVWTCLKNPPFNLNESKLEIANLITSLCCEEIEVERLNDTEEWVKMIRSVLPQGAPTSPILTNIVSQRLDYQLYKLAKRFNLKYSRYADDITFSSMHHVYKKDSEFISELRNIIKEQNFYINESKVRLQTQGYQRQEVTGIVVNEKVNIKREYIKDIRRWLYLWERYGHNRTNEIFIFDYKKKHHNLIGEPNFINVLCGKLEYLKMVIGYDDNRFNQLNNRYNKLYDKIHPPSVLIEKKAIKTQTKLYKKAKEDTIDLSKHKPRDVTRFLSLFEAGELKWLTHGFEKVGIALDIDQLINNALQEFNKNTDQYIIPESLYARILAFITGKKEKGTLTSWVVEGKPYPFHWQSKETREWCERNPYKSPVFAEEFETIINIFKSSIKIKNSLEDIIKKTAAIKLGSDYVNYNIEYKNLNEPVFYTDVEKLRIGLGFIFNSIKQQGLENNKIKIEFIKSRNLRLIKIIHIDSFSKKNLDKKELFGGDLIEVEKNFYQICDWSIIAENPESEYCNKINILFDINSNKLVKEKIEEKIEGFTHELTFHI